MRHSIRAQQGQEAARAQRIADVRENPHVHVPRLVTTHTTRRQSAAGSAVRTFNSKLAVVITRSVGTMWAAYLFLAISLVSLPAALAALVKGDTFTAVSWLSQSFLQLVLLPIIIVGQNVISAAQDARAEADHETLTALHELNVRQLMMLEEQRRILDLLEGRAVS